MNEPLPPALPQNKSDADHLKLLAIFHFVVSGLAILGLFFLFFHYFVMSTIMKNPEVWKDSHGPDPREFFALFKWFYLIFGSFLIIGSIANLISGFFIRKRKNRLFSLIVAGVDCLQIPFGTALGVFTFIVLLRPSVRETYELRQKS